MKCVSLLKALMPALLLAASCAPRTARADLLFDLSPLNLTLSAGASYTRTYSATLTNTFDFPLYLNGDFFSLDPPLSLDDSAFQNTFVTPTDMDGNPLDPPTLDANGGTLTVPIFTVSIPDTAPAGQYGGGFLIQGGASFDAFDTLASAEFTINLVTPSGVPEPGALALGSGLAACGLSLLRTRRRPR
jgi:hypothetical protein